MHSCVEQDKVLLATASSYERFPGESVNLSTAALDEAATRLPLERVVCANGICACTDSLCTNGCSNSHSLTHSLTHSTPTVLTLSLARSLTHSLGTNGIYFLTR